MNQRSDDLTRARYYAEDDDLLERELSVLHYELVANQEPRPVSVREHLNVLFASLARAGLK